MEILAIDPGPEKSAYVLLSEGLPLAFDILPNEILLKVLDDSSLNSEIHLVLEMIACYGLPVGAEVFQTCLWIGRFIERWKRQAHLVYRKDVKMTLCHSMRAKDAHIRQALIDAYSIHHQNPVGTKKNPGPLYGIKSHLWAALGVAVTFHDQMRKKESDALQK